MQLQIDSRRLGKTVTFSRPVGTNYVFIDLNGGAGTLGQQICRGGRLNMGSTITSYDDANFERICLRWWRAYFLELDRINWWNEWNEAKR